MTVEIFRGASGFQRTAADLCSSETLALRTPATFWMASVTCRAQLLQVMPSTCNSVAVAWPVARASIVPFVDLSLTRRLCHKPAVRSNFRFGQYPGLAEAVFSG